MRRHIRWLHVRFALKLMNNNMTRHNVLLKCEWCLAVGAEGDGISAVSADHEACSGPAYRINVRNSLRVLSDLRKAPSIADVTVVAPGFWTPRMVMHMCL